MIIATVLVYVGCGISTISTFLIWDLLHKLGKKQSALPSPVERAVTIEEQDRQENNFLLPILSGPYAYGAYREMGDLRRSLLSRPSNPDLDIHVGKRNSHRPLPPQSISAAILWEDAQRALAALGQESITITGLGTVTAEPAHPKPGYITINDPVKMLYTTIPDPQLNYAEYLTDEGMVPGEHEERDGEKLREEL